jgi:NitT/TauT family transport system permease protein
LAEIAVPRSEVARTATGRTRTRSARRAAVWVFQRTIGLAVLAALWQLLPTTGVIKPEFVAPLSDVASAWWSMLKSGELMKNVDASLLRALAGLGVAVVVFIPLGLLIGWYRSVGTVLNPVIELFRSTAPLAILPIFVLLLGIGEVSKIAVVVFACAWPVLLNTVSGVSSVDPVLVKSARSLGLSPARLFQKVILPSAVPAIFTGIRLAGAAAILVLIAAELIGSTAGLGYLINYTQQNFQIPQMYAAILTVSVLGLIINQLLVLLERHFSRWRVSPTP